MRRRIWAVAVFWAWGCGPKAGDGAGEDTTTPPPEGCTEIGCHDGLIVRVTPSSGWPHGMYRFVIEADGETTTCARSLPLPECGTPALPCEGPPVMIGASGCALDPSEHGFGDVVFEAAPEQVRIEIARDGEVIAAQEWTPQYETVQPNGPGCEPICETATVELAVEF